MAEDAPGGGPPADRPDGASPSPTAALADLVEWASDWVLDWSGLGAARKPTRVEAAAAHATRLTALLERCAGALDGFRGDLLRPGEPGFDAALRLAGAANAGVLARRPALIVVPADQDDVKKALALVRAGMAAGAWGETPLTVCGGGHSPLCVRDGAVLLHLKRLSAVRCDPAARTVTVGGGAKLGDVNRATVPHGLAVPLGWAETVGAGLMLTGGIGRLTRLHGLTVDNVLEVTAVLPDGRVKVLAADAEREEDRELFWGMRGAGANFGVVTQLKLRAHPLGDGGHVLYAKGNRPLAAAAGADLHAIALALRDCPGDQQSDLVVGHVGDELHVGFFMCDLGLRGFPEAVLRAARLSPAPAFARVAWTDVPYSDLPAAPGGEKLHQDSGGVFSHVRQQFVDEVGPDVLEAVAAAVRDKAPTKLCCVLFHHGGGRARAYDRGSAFACRNWEFSIVIVGLWQDPARAAATVAWADALYETLAPWATGCYAVDIDRFARPATAEAELAHSFKGHLPRLRALQRRVDPAGMLRGAFLGFPGDAAGERGGLGAAVGDVVGRLVGRG